MQQKKQKLIGIPGWLNDQQFGVGKVYMEFISRFGIPVIITPQHVHDIPDVDMLYLPGGLDVNPAAYGAIPSYHTQNSNVMLEFFEARILPKYLEKQTSIFAVCRSSQSLYGKWGGAITQHCNNHKQSSYPEDECHGLVFTKEYKGLDLYINNVTSRHHQNMDGRKVPDCLNVIAYAEESNGKNPFVRQDIVEIWEHKTLPIIGWQSHPESHSEQDRLATLQINSLLKLD